jgi:hypothetical protein
MHRYQSVCLFVRFGSPFPLSRKQVYPPLGTKGEQHSLAGEGAGGTNSDNWKENLALCLLCADNIQNKFILCKGIQYVVLY